MIDELKELHGILQQTFSKVSSAVSNAPKEEIQWLIEDVSGNIAAAYHSIGNRLFKEGDAEAAKILNITKEEV